MISLCIFFVRRHILRKKKRAALSEEAMQSDSSTEMPGPKDHDRSPMRSVEPDPIGEIPRRDISEKQLEILQGAADTIVNVKSTDLPGSSLGNLRELESTSRPEDGPAELPEEPMPTTCVPELDGGKSAPRMNITSPRAELRGSTTPDLGIRSELESAAVRHDQRPLPRSLSNYRDVFIDAPERLTPRSSTDGRRRPAELAT
ncbi:uncharacterized protein PG986_013769 [Apiospora aurea]|uniref:Uncharacterized protein n=1 Tax=Apiospora aurea TaxID=335848 RepID=A0ABR1PWH2_9PEZI